MRRHVAAWTIAATCALVWHLAEISPRVAAQSGFRDPNATLDPAEFGRVSPFIPMQSVEAVHMGLVWKRNLRSRTELSCTPRSSMRPTSR